jgi:hypothetical protein
VVLVWMVKDRFDQMRDEGVGAVLLESTSHPDEWGAELWEDIFQDINLFTPEHTTLFPNAEARGHPRQALGSGSSWRPARPWWCL